MPNAPIFGQATQKTNWMVHYRTEQEPIDRSFSEEESFSGKKIATEQKQSEFGHQQNESKLKSRKSLSRRGSVILSSI